ncbi:MAG: hypothetical protein EA402_09250 [Planctomycetota bacterium]|nr:MAG: hypothetical protein EA402_09250 [Planctomycetota bacterium]
MPGLEPPPCPFIWEGGVDGGRLQVRMGEETETLVHASAMAEFLSQQRLVGAGRMAILCAMAAVRQTWEYSQRHGRCDGERIADHLADSCRTWLSNFPHLMALRTMSSALRDCAEDHLHRLSGGELAARLIMEGRRLMNQWWQQLLAMHAHLPRLQPLRACQDGLLDPLLAEAATEATAEARILLPCSACSQATAQLSPQVLTAMASEAPKRLILVVEPGQVAPGPLSHALPQGVAFLSPSGISHNGPSCEGEAWQGSLL